MPVIVVQHTFEPPVDVGSFNSAEGSMSPCLPAHDLTWLGSYFATDGSRGICLYEADSAESVRRAYRSARVPFSDAWPATSVSR